jgi:hypothetical protein
MLLGIAVEAGRIGIEQRPHVGRLLAVVALDRGPHLDQLGDIVGRGPVRPGQRAEPAAGHRDHFFQRREIILGMGVGQTISHVRIAPSEHMRHPEPIAHDPHVIGPAAGAFARYTPIGSHRLSPITTRSRSATNAPSTFHLRLTRPRAMPDVWHGQLASATPPVRPSRSRRALVRPASVLPRHPGESRDPRTPP